MPGFGTGVRELARPCGVLAAALALPWVFSSVPAQAQDIFGFFRALSQPAAPAPAPQPYEFRPDPSFEQPRHTARPRRKPAPVAEAEVKKPVEPRPRGEIDNPVPALLADSTLQPGDMVMFPDGLRVFAGRAGGPHKMADFKPLSQAAKTLPKATRKLIAHLLPGENPTWSTAALKTGNKLAANVKDVETTGSVARTGSRRSTR